MFNIFRCHASSGKCDCPPGWTGIYCDTPCPAGHYGQDCQEKCNCKNGATCNHITGTSTDQGPSINDKIILKGGGGAIDLEKKAWTLRGKGQS